MIISLVLISSDAHLSRKKFTTTKKKRCTMYRTNFVLSIKSPALNVAFKKPIWNESSAATTHLWPNFRGSFLCINVASIFVEVF